MHIPDGFLSPTVSIVTFIVTIVFWAISFMKTKNSLDERQVPIMGVLTALFFAAQMMNYPIVGGTTGHLLGGASLGIILGPYAGCISMTIILVLQSLLFGDGGITALGANVLNMGIIGVFIPAFLLLALNKISKGKDLLAWVFISAFAGDVAAAVSAGAQLGFSVPTFQYGLSVAVPAMAINHSVIGVIEGVVTMVLVGALLKLRPDVMSKSPSLKDLPIVQESNT
ncbi:MAG: energy-coupling factor ABC transporter permease [Candidatus Bathyarchaeota archaeon]|nr:energy-coupling factor ABC transporter permease [Candidatus Bathyarchaeota archaeon]